MTSWRARSAIVAITVASASLGALATPQQDVERALADARARAVAGDAVAQFTLGSLLYYGTPQTAEAIEWFRKAANQGFAAAEFQMGQMYDAGFGVPADPAVALDWYRKAAAHGSAAGQRAVGDFHLKGRGLRADPIEALAWYQQAADRDDLRAQYQLGQLYFSAEGVPRDYVSAYVWFTIAAGQAPLVDNRKQLVELANIAAARMSPADLGEARRRVAAWRPAAPGR